MGGPTFRVSSDEFPTSCALDFRFWGVYSVRVVPTFMIIIMVMIKPGRISKSTSHTPPTYPSVVSTAGNTHNTTLQ